MYQMSLFDFMQERPPETFNPIASYAMRKTIWVGGKKRIQDFFFLHQDQSDRVAFLKKEYGGGGFSYSNDSPCALYNGEWNGSGLMVEYNDERGKKQKRKFTYAELAKEIDLLISVGRYIENDEQRNKMIS